MKRPDSCFWPPVARALRSGRGQYHGGRSQRRHPPGLPHAVGDFRGLGRRGGAHVPAGFIESMSHP